MNARTLIADLTALVEKHGDLEVHTDMDFEILAVEYSTEGEEPDFLLATGGTNG